LRWARHVVWQRNKKYVLVRNISKVDPSETGKEIGENKDMDFRKTELLITGGYK
jgi:hypothetical protein